MNNSKLSYGLNLAKKPGLSRPAPPRRKPIFSGEDGSEDESPTARPPPLAEEISELDDFAPKAPDGDSIRAAPKSKMARSAPSHPPSSKLKTAAPDLGDLSSALAARKYGEEAEKLDPSIYDYDGAYDSFKARKKPAEAGPAERKPQYMSSLRKMAEIRERDRKMAEDKKVQREREAEGDEYADKEKFVTEAYKKQQEDNRRLEEEERRREDEEARKNKSGGMTGFYQQLLDQGEQRHAEMVKAAEDEQRKGPRAAGEEAEEGGADEDREKRDAKMARDINAHGGSIAINEEGQVVDKRELLKGGLNVAATKKAEEQKATSQRGGRDSSSAGQARGFFAGGKQAMRDRQSRMLEAQYEQALKRAREEEEQEQSKVELVAKSRKTGADISSARERYLARKKAEAEDKKGIVDVP